MEAHHDTALMGFSLISILVLFFCIRCMRLFQTHLGLSWTRYDVISVSAARLLVAAVGCSCCKVHGNSRGEFVGDRPPQLIPATHLLRIYGCQQNVSATVVVGKSSHVFFGIENSWFSSPGYRKSIPAFPAMSFKSCATSLHELWTPLLGRSCRGNRHWGANVWDLELGTDWTGILRHKA